MFWLMTFLEAASHIGSQVIGNFFTGSGATQNMVAPYSAAALLAIVSIIYATQRSEEAPRASTFKDYRHSFWTYILAGIICIMFLTVSCRILNISILC